MDEKTLLRILKQENADASSYYASELAEAQEDAMCRFYAEDYGDELPDRSKVHTHDVEDTINWLLPDIQKAFRNSEDLVEVEAGRPQDEDITDCASDYLAHVFFKDNQGKIVTYDMAFDGLLQRIGVCRVAWEDASPKPPKLIEGVTHEKLVEIFKDPEYEIKSQDERVIVLEGQQIPVFDIEVIHTPKMGRVVVEAIPPEEYRVSRRAKDNDKADYEARERYRFLSEIKAAFPHKKRQLEEANADNSSSEDDILDDDGRKEARFPDEADTNFSKESVHESRRKVKFIEEFVKIDYDNDDIVELRHIKRVGDVILENVIVEDSEFVSWSPIRISHKKIGRSIADQIIDLQKIRTVIARRSLDSLDQQLSPRIAYDKGRLQGDSYDELLDNEIGGTVSVDGEPSRALMPIVTPDLTGPAFNMLEYWDQESEQRTGVTRLGQGLDPQALTKTATGMNQLQNAGLKREDLIVDLLRDALEIVFQRILKLIVAHQDHERLIKLKGKWISIDPRSWSDDMSVSVHIGGIKTRDQQLQDILMIAGKQEQVIATAGASNPLVNIKHLRNSYAEMVQTMGIKNPDRYFADIPDDYQPPQPEPQQDPKVIEAQAKAQLEQQKAQSAQQVKEFEVQANAQLKSQELESNITLAVRKLDSEIQLKTRQVAFELDLKERQIAAELQIKKQAIAHQQSTNQTSEVHVGGDPG